MHFVDFSMISHGLFYHLPSHDTQAVGMGWDGSAGAWLWLAMAMTQEYSSSSRKS